MHLAFMLVRESWATDAPEGAGRKSGYNIGCLLVDPTCKIIAWGLNEVKTNKSFHAETAMIQSYLERHGVENLPANCTMYTSLESCHMCAGFGAHASNGLRVVYGQKDDQIVNNAFERGVNESSQLPTTAVFHPGADSPLKMQTSAAIDAVSALFAKYRLDTRRLGAVGFLYSALGKYFYEQEKKMPGQMKGALETIAQAPNPARAPAYLDLAMPRKLVDSQARVRMNQFLMGPEMRLAEHAVAFVEGLVKIGVLI